MDHVSSERMFDYKVNVGSQVFIIRNYLITVCSL